jgi:hypothetical protein
MRSKRYTQRDQTARILTTYLFILLTCTPALPQEAGGVKSGVVIGNRANVNSGDPMTSPDSGVRGFLPFRVELGEGISNPRAEVVLAVKAVTVFHCPEPPMQVLIGDTTGLGLVESVEGQDRADFYLRPTKSGVRTNMWIEMPSATVHVGLRTIEVKGGARIGDYNGEVFVRLPGFREKAESARARAAVVEKELAECLIRQEQLKQEGEEGKRRIAAETESLMMDEILAVLATASFGSRRDSKPTRVGPALIWQVGSTARIGTRRLWVVLEIENRDKSRAHRVQELSAGGDYKVRTREGRLPPVEPGKRVRVAVMVERVSNNLADKEYALPKLNITVEGSTGGVELRP